MDLIIIVIHFLISFFVVSLAIIPSITVVGYTALWGLLIDRTILNFLIAIPMRLLIKRGLIDIPTTTLIIEIIKAPISVYLGGFVLGLILQDVKVVYAFSVGYILWLIPLYFIGTLKNHPNKYPMLIGIILGSFLGLYLLTK